MSAPQSKDPQRDDSPQVHSQRSSSHQLTSDAIGKELANFITSLIGAPVSQFDDLTNKGLDSVAFLEVIIFVERKLQIPLPLSLLTSAPLTTIAALSEQIVTLSTRDSSPPTNETKHGTP